MNSFPFVTEEGTLVFTRQQRDEIKKNVKTFGKFNKRWNDSGFASKQIIGPCMELITNSNAATEKEWQTYYMHKQMDWAKIERLGAKWAYISGLSPELGLAHVIIHIFDETWDGYHREISVMNWLNENHPEFKNRVFRPDYVWDTDYAIDLAVKDASAPNGFITGI